MLESILALARNKRTSNAYTKFVRKRLPLPYLFITGQTAPAGFSQETELSQTITTYMHTINKL